MRCTYCGQESPEGTAVCPNCGNPLTAPAAPAYYVPAQAYVPPPPTSGAAIASLVTGILGLTLCPGIASIVAVITGSMAKKEIEGSGGKVGGSGLATAGLVTGWIGIGIVGLIVLGFCLVLVTGLLMAYSSPR